MGKKGGGTNTITEIPPEFKPAFQQLFAGGLRAGEQVAANTGFQQPPPPLPSEQFFGGAQPSNLGGTTESFGGGEAGGFGSFGAAAPPTAPAGDTGTREGFATGGEATLLPPQASPQPINPFSFFPGFGNRGGFRGGGNSQLSLPGNTGPGGIPITQDPGPTVSQPQRAGNVELPTSGFVNLENLQGTQEGVGFDADRLVAAPFQGDIIAGANPLELQSLADRANLGSSLEGIGDPLLNLGTATARGDFLSPESNPFLARTLLAALRPVTEAFGIANRDLSSASVDAGAFQGSSRRDLLGSQLAGQFGSTVGDISANLLGDNLARERALQQQAGTLLSQGAQLAQLPSEIGLQTGAAIRELDQRSLENQLAQFQQLIAGPFAALNPLASLIQGQDIGSNQTTTRPVNALGGGIQGGLGGLGLGTGITEALGLEGGQAQFATGLSGLLGLLGGGLGG